MPRITPIDPATAAGPAKELLDQVQHKLGMVPNLLRTLAQAPAALRAYLALSQAVGSGSLSAQERERLALRIAEHNHCDYCLAAHSAIGASVGLAPEAIADARRGDGVEQRDRALLQFTDDLLSNSGFVSEAGLAAAREQGLSDGDLLEVVANLALNTLTNYANHLAETEVDFPAADPLTV